MLDNQLKKQAQLRESILAFVAILVVCYGAYSLLYSPRHAQNKELTAQLQELQDRQAGVEKLIAVLQKKVDQRLNEVSEEAGTNISSNPKLQMLQKSRNPEFKNVSDFLNSITRDATKPTITINSLSYDALQSHDGYQSAKFIIYVNGHYADLIDFIKLIENKAALITLDKLNLLVDGTDATKVSLELNGTYYQLRSDDV